MSFATTVRVNPEGASPILTQEQVWKGLQYKGRHPAAFLGPMLKESKVLEEGDEGWKYTRQVRMGEGPLTNEEVQEYEPSVVYFEMATGMRVLNIISQDSDSNLLLTFSFVKFLGPPMTVEQRAGAVKKTVDEIRAMVKDGKL